jgi:hypothetical protein
VAAGGRFAFSVPTAVRGKPAPEASVGCSLLINTRWPGGCITSWSVYYRNATRACLE